MTTAKFSVAVLGGSGNVGRHVIRHLVADDACGKVVMINRRDIEEFAAVPKVSQHVVDMNNLEAASQDILKNEQVQAAIITLGVGKPSKSNKEELERVDVSLPTAFSAAAKAVGVNHMALLTAVGADITQSYSRITKTGAGGGYYNHLKGTVEKNIKDHDFDSTSIFQPATILGNSNTPGALEYIAPAFRWALPSRYKDIHASNLAGAIVTAVKSAVTQPQDAPKTETYVGKSLFGLVDQFKADCASRKDEL